MTEAIDVTGWHHERIAGFIEAIQGNSTAVEISLTVRDNGEQQLSMRLTGEPSSDFVARECQQCQSITVAKVLPLNGLPKPKTLDAAAAPGRNGTSAD
jgi:hypothetical protein